MSRMSGLRLHTFDVGHRYKARDARDHWKDVLDAAEGGAAAVIERNRPVGVVDAALLEELLSDKAPFSVQSSVAADQVAFWLEDGLVHAVGGSLDEATGNFLDALVDYAEAWFAELRDAPNHAHNRLLVLRVVLLAGDRAALEAAVFDD